MGIILLIAFGALLFLPKNPPPTPTTPDPVPQGPSFTKEGELAFMDASGRDTLSIIDIEIVDTEAEITTGLMYRRSMPVNAGMLFVFDRPEPRSFWMKNTHIPLDIIFIDDFQRIVTIQANTRPMSEASVPSSKPAQYVLEVNAGFCQQQGITEGSYISF